MEGEIILPSARAALLLFDNIKSMTRRAPEAAMRPMPIAN
jgi:hypothetical protein